MKAGRRSGSNDQRREQAMMMRNMLLVGVSAAALFVSSQARAQWPTADELADANTLNTANSTADTVTKLKDQLENMKQQLATAQQIFGSLSHGVSNPLQASASQFNIPGLRNVLPTGSSQLGGVMNGSNLGNMGGLGTQYLNTNRVYQPQGDDFAATQMRANANSIAGVQATSDKLYQSASSHMSTLEDLEDQLNNSPDAKTTADLQARIAQEQTYLQAQQVQAQSISNWQQAQVRNEQEQGDEKQRKDIDDVLSADAAATPGS